MELQLDVQRRAYHRVRFPIAERPCWTVGDTSFMVVDLSESGCRLALRGHEAIRLEQSWKGTLRFADGEQIWIEGEAIRADDEAIVIRLAKGVTFKKIMSLQRDLLRKYPAWRQLTP